MISALLTIPIAVAIFGIMTLGAVLLVKFFLGRLARSTRVFIASVACPFATLVPTSLFSLTEGNADIVDVLIALLVGGGFISAILCWPVAHFATKRLDRLTEFDVETFT